MILAGQRSINTFRTSWLQTLMTRRGCTGRSEGLREKPRKGVVVSVPRIERNCRLLLLPLFIPVQDLLIQRVVSLIEGFFALRSVWGLVLRWVVFVTLQVRLALFSTSDLWRYSQAISNILQYLLAIFVSCFSIDFWYVQNANISAVRSLADTLFSARSYTVN